MAGGKTFQFGLVIRGQYPIGDDMAKRFAETVAMARRAEALGFDSLTKTSHFSSHPFQMFQQVPLLARFTAEVPKLRLNAGIVILPLHTPLEVAENFAAIDIMSGGKLIFGVALGYRDIEFKAFGVPMRDRVRRFEDNLIAIKRLWTEDTVSMKAGHFQPLVSRRTTAMVEVHCMAKAKKIMRASAPPRVRSLCSAACRLRVWVLGSAP